MKKIKQKVSELVVFSISSQLAFLLFAEIIIGLSITILTLTLFLKLGDKVLDKEVIFFDGTVTHFIYHLRTPSMTTVMRDISFFGGEILLGVAVLVTIL